MSMIKKLLIANRGEIACRIAATAKKMGIATVAIYSDTDMHLPHVAACDEAIGLNGKTALETYLNIDKVILAAKETGATAVHPGYGFLSESYQFSEACIANQLIFVGPNAASMRAMGLKAEAKTLMQRAGVPIVSGYHGDNQNTKFLHEQAQKVGYPLMIKASAGGGGRGIRIVRRDEDFFSELESCQREAQSSFGHKQVLIEKYLEKPRHIEVQVFGDQLGNCVYLFERDCSVQRRHQKIIEEAPCHTIDEATRKKLGQVAVSAAKAVNYVGAGTVEFIAQHNEEGGLDFYFMEMNTRLQVEHPVTEAITGQDLVAWQLQVAAGLPLPCQQEDLYIQGHALEIRLCAENPDKDFLPSIGRLKVFEFPPASEFEVSDLRVDRGFVQGNEISTYFDSMLAKMIVHAATRESAVAKLEAALAQTKVVGVSTNVQYLRRVLSHPGFQGADLDTGFLGREAAVLLQPPAQNHYLVAMGVIAAMVQKESSKTCHAWQNPWAQKSHWRMAGQEFECEFVFQLANGNEVITAKLDPKNGSLRLNRDEQGYAFSWLKVGKNEYLIYSKQGDALEKENRVSVYQEGSQITVFTHQGVTELSVQDEVSLGSTVVHAKASLCAPMPGKILSVLVELGQTVEKGQCLAVMEAMKMEHSISAPYGGEVIAVFHQAGEQIIDGAVLFEIKANE